MLNLVLFGPPGAGKGTQSENLINKYGLVHLSTGDILRSEIKRGTELGKKAQAIMERGELVSDDIVIGMIEAKLDENEKAKGFIFDGFPRTTAQAIALDDLLQKKGTGISAMLALEVEDEELVARLLNRGKDSGRPDDRDENVIRRRISVYNAETAPLKKYYSEQAKFHSIHGIGSIDAIFNELINRIVFIQAEMELSALETEIEHLDMTIKDFEVAREIEPELLLEIDAIKRAEAEEATESRRAKRLEKIKPAPAKTVTKATPTKKAEPTKKTAAKNTPAKNTPAKKSTAKTAPAKKASAKKSPAKKSTPKKAVKKVAKKVTQPIAKKAVKKAVAKKVAPKKAAKVAPKKAIKKAPKKVAVKKKVSKPVAKKKVAPVKKKTGKKK